tara:strand:- start:1800 stop:1994 length:195 start_codon:yes stop_codon:yes gene_type:complete
MGVNTYMNLSYHEIMSLIKKEQVKHQKNIKDGPAQVNTDYSRHAFFAMREFEKTVRNYLAKKYP